MDFLVKASPSVDWKAKKVTCYVGNKKYNLPTCNITNVNTLCDDNQFAGLHVDDDNDNSEHELSSDAVVTKNSNTGATVQGCLK
jgi:hypothetical protein